MEKTTSPSPAGQAEPDPKAEIAAVVEAWRAGESVWSIEMGGLGPGYEQAIQVLIFEMLADLKDLPLPETKEAWRSWGDDTVKRLDDSCGGFSGAQVGAAKNVAANILRRGYKAAMDSVPQDRKIQVSQFWPKAEGR